MRPSDLSLPPKFREFREGQYEAALELALTEERFSVLSAPTGSGKSLVYMTAAKLLDARTLVLTGTKGLQDQLMEDFQSIGLIDMKGRNNYECVLLRDPAFQEYGRPGWSAEYGPCRDGLRCELKEGGCPYYDQQALAFNSDLVVTNYSYWMSIGKYLTGLEIGSFDLLILDEAHSAHDWLSDFCSIKINDADFHSWLKRHVPSVDMSMDDWADWAREAYNDLREVHHWAKNRVSKKEIRKMERMIRGLSDLSNVERGIEWLGEKTNSGMLFSPVWSSHYSERYLFRGINRIILSSATITEDSCKYLGIDEKFYLEVSSSFPAKRRPFIWIPTVKMSWKMLPGDKRVWLNRIDRILRDRLDRKTIIHTRSYDRARYILEHSKHKAHMLGHTSKTLRPVIEKFKLSDPPCILVSPSVEEGFDFPMDECRCQIVGKVPFVNGTTPLMKARKKSDKNYLNHLAALSLIQMVGRGMRARDDFCETFIIDDHWVWFRKSVKFPGWFRESWLVRDCPFKPDRSE